MTQAFVQRACQTPRRGVTREIPARASRPGNAPANGVAQPDAGARADRARHSPRRAGGAAGSGDRL